MITSWYIVSSSLFLSLFIIGYIILFENCNDDKSDTDCKSGLGGKVGACLILMIMQSCIQVYFAMVATWFY